MPGFGDHPIGGSPAGRWPWAVEALYNRIPELYRTEDEDHGFVLRKLFESAKPLYDRILELAENFGDVRDAQRTPASDERSIVRLGARVVPSGEVQQAGVDGRITSGLEFSAGALRVSDSDVGKSLRLRGVVNGVLQTRVFQVTRVLSPNTVLLSPLPVYDPGEARQRWELLTFPDANPDVFTYEVLSGAVGDVRPGWCLFDGNDRFEILGRRQFPVPGSTLLVDREGSDGSINLAGELLVPSSTFGVYDVGRRVAIQAIDADTESTLHEIVRVTGSAGAWVLTVDPLPEQDGSVYWAVWPWAQLDLQGPRAPRGAVIVSGNTGSVTSANTVSLTGAGRAFTAANVGDVVSFWDAAQSSAVQAQPHFQVVSVVDSTTLQVSWLHGVTALTNSSSVSRWELRNRTVAVELQGPSLVQPLAQDRGVRVSPIELEQSQRDVVDNVWRWNGKRGHEEAYESLGAWSGFAIDAIPLYAIDFEHRADARFTGLIVEAIDGIPGHAGTRGALTLAGTLVDPAANFRRIDPGQYVRMGAGQLYRIDSRVSATEVAVTYIEGAIAPTLPSYGSGASASTATLSWAVVRWYLRADQVSPYGRRYDDFDADLLYQLYGQTVDVYCWEANGEILIDCTISDVGATGSGRSIVQIHATVPTAPEIPTRVGPWYLRFDDGTEIPLETLPALYSPGEYRAEIANVGGLSLPGTHALLAYDCQDLSDCGFCASRRVLARISSGSAFSNVTDPEYIEQVFDRVLERLEYVKPAHVRLVAERYEDLQLTVPFVLTLDAEDGIETATGSAAVVFGASAQAEDVGLALLATSLGWWDAQYAGSLTDVATTIPTAVNTWTAANITFATGQPDPDGGNNAVKLTSTAATSTYCRAPSDANKSFGYTKFTAKFLPFNNSAGVGNAGMRAISAASDYGNTFILEPGTEVAARDEGLSYSALDNHALSSTWRDIGSGWRALELESIARSGNATLVRNQPDLAVAKSSATVEDLFTIYQPTITHRRVTSLAPRAGAVPLAQATVQSKHTVMPGAMLGRVAIVGEPNSSDSTAAIALGTSPWLITGVMAPLRPEWSATAATDPVFVLTGGTASVSLVIHSGLAASRATYGWSRTTDGAVTTGAAFAGSLATTTPVAVSLYFDGSTLSLFVDGQRVGSPVAVSGTATLSGFALRGRAACVASASWSALSGARSDTEIEKVALSARAQAGLPAKWKMVLWTGQSNSTNGHNNYLRAHTNAPFVLGPAIAQHDLDAVYNYAPVPFTTANRPYWWRWNDRRNSVAGSASGFLRAAKANGRYDLLVASMGKGGEAITSWRAGGTHLLYDHIRNVAWPNAVADVGTHLVEMGAIVWIQGEADAAAPSGYAAALAEVVAWMRAFGGNASAPALVLQLNTNFNVTDPTALRAEQASFVSSDGNAVLVNANYPAPHYDGVHYSEHGLACMGEQIYRTWAGLPAIDPNAP